MIGVVSPHETPSTILLEEHYKRLGLSNGWTVERVNRLCGMLHVTPYELGALCCIPFQLTTKWMRMGMFPPYVALHFAVIESWYVETVLNLPQKPVMPVEILVQND